MWHGTGHQTVRLSAGAHTSPQEGACVLELASMLSDEPFCDMPQSVCPALRAFLHGYNDKLPDELRQQLYGLASEIVGTRRPPQLTAWRARLCVDWARSLAGLEGVSPRFRGWTLGNCTLAGEYSARMARREPWCHRQTLAFVRWLANARSPNIVRAPAIASAPDVPRDAWIEPERSLAPAYVLA